MLPKQKGLSQGHRVQKEQIQDLITSPCVKIQIVWHISLSSLELDLFQLNLMPSAHHTLGFTSVQVPREQPAHSDLQAFAQAISCNCHPPSSLHFFTWLFACHPFILSALTPLPCLRKPFPIPQSVLVALLISALWLSYHDTLSTLHCNCLSSHLIP